MEKHEKLVVATGLQSVTDNARQHASEGYPDCPKTDPATFTAEFLEARKAEGMPTRQALVLLNLHP